MGKLTALKELKKAYLQQMFPQEGESVPRLRFAGFEGEWEQRKLGEMLISLTTRNYIVEKIDGSTNPVIQQGNTPTIGFSDDEPFANYEDVTLFGDHTLSLYKPASPFLLATDGIKILQIDKVDGFFTHYLLERNIPIPEGYKRHFSILKDTSVWFTADKFEQTAIGNFFRALDELITLHS